MKILPKAFPGIPIPVILSEITNFPMYEKTLHRP